jgi:imidazolonepropionase-like amidohydrolase
VIRLSFACLVLAACAHAPVVPIASTAIAFVDATVVTSGRASPHQTVVVDGDRIVSVGTAAAPAGARVISASGKYLVPGFSDMHVHLPESQADIDRVLDLSLACGVTTIRSMQGKPSHLEARKRVRVAPDLVLAGPPVTEALTPDQGRALVREQKAAGYDLIKIIGGLDRAAYDAIVAEAAAEHIPVVGHVPKEIGLDAALAAKQLTIEHVQGYARDDDALLADQVRRTVAAGVWNCPTLDFYTVALGPRDHLAERDGMAYATDDERSAPASPPPADGDARLAKVLHVVAALHAAGAPLLVGSDTPDNFAVPGFAYGEEMRALAHAGLTPADVLRAATENAAASLGRPGDGKIVAGARADLVLLDRDPLTSVDNLTHPDGVMVKGHWLTRADLDALLARHARPR